MNRPRLIDVPPFTRAPSTLARLARWARTVLPLVAAFAFGIVLPVPSPSAQAGIPLSPLPCGQPSTCKVRRMVATTTTVDDYAWKQNSGTVLCLDADSACGTEIHAASDHTLHLVTDGSDIILSTAQVDASPAQLNIDGVRTGQNSFNGI